MPKDWKKNQSLKWVATFFASANYLRCFEYCWSFLLWNLRSAKFIEIVPVMFYLLNSLISHICLKMDTGFRYRLKLTGVVERGEILLTVNWLKTFWKTALLANYSWFLFYLILCINFISDLMRFLIAFLVQIVSFCKTLTAMFQL